MANIYYIGDWAVMCGPVFAETPFNYAYKGLETVNYGRWLKDALEKQRRTSGHLGANLGILRAWTGPV